MRQLILAALVFITDNGAAQNNTASNLIEGGKTLVELVRVFKSPKNNLSQQNLVEKKDSCSIKNISDLCIKNSTAKTLLVSLYKRNGNGYDAGVLSMRVLPKNQEYFYEIKSGVYKMKLETEEGEIKKVFREGEVKLNACENLVKEIKNE
jgi:hypothetical protein